MARVTTGKRKQIVLEGEPDESDSGQPGQPQMIDFTVEPRGKDAEVEKRDKKKKKKKKQESEADDNEKKSAQMADAPEENDKEHPVQENASGKKKKKNDTPLENQASPLEKNVRPQRDAAKKAAEVPTTSQNIVYLFIYFH